MQDKNIYAMFDEICEKHDKVSAETAKTLIFLRLRVQAVQNAMFATRYAFIRILFWSIVKPRIAWELVDMCYRLLVMDYNARQEAQAKAFEEAKKQQAAQKAAPPFDPKKPDFKILEAGSDTVPPDAAIKEKAEAK